eukprot:Pompholyxophrys_sp_v1_NODE_12_length_5133_cov_3.790272.p4 type:complete len:130 gc:universal NODE_12_length_5133_cov_3.790272:1890-2279(+)
MLGLVRHGRMLSKTKLKIFLDTSEANYDKWVSGYTASEKRILTTKWSAEAWDKFCKTFDFAAAGARCGLLQTIDQSNKIQPQGFTSPLIFSENDVCKVTAFEEKRSQKTLVKNAKSPKRQIDRNQAKKA